MKRILPALLTVLLTSCSLVKPYEQPKFDMGDTWKGSSETSQNHDAAWWNEFHTEELNGLVNEALQSNTDLRAGLQRIAQSRAQVKIAGANLYPSLGAGGNFSVTDSDNSSGHTSYGADISASYEVDLWKRNANARDAAKASLNATRFDRDALALVVTTETTQRYFEILSLKERIKLTEDTIRIFRDTLTIIDARFKEGATSGLEVAQQKTTLANAEASLSTLRNQLTTTQNALAILLGKTPAQFKQDFAGTLDKVALPDIKPNLPSSLLTQRPDIRAQEEILKAAHANIGVARADLFPSLTLSGTLSAAANPSSDPYVFSSGIVASLAQRIFEGGRLEGQVELAKAQEKELIETYHTAILVAFRETEDALSGVQTAQEREIKLDTALKESRKSYQIAKERYDSGATDFLTLLDAQRTLLTAQDNFVQAKLDRFVNALSLINALGGFWQESADTL